jgi:hypothetical protein
MDLFYLLINQDRMLFESWKILLQRYLVEIWLLLGVDFFDVQGLVDANLDGEIELVLDYGCVSVELDFLELQFAGHFRFFESVGDVDWLVVACDKVEVI